MNSRLGLLLALVFALALGAAGGYFAGRESVETLHPRRGAADPCAPEIGNESGIKGASKTEGAFEKPSREGNTSRPPKDPISEPSLKAAIDSVKVETPPKGTGKITGNVRKPDGTPIAGATITARPQAAPKAKPRKEKPSLEDEVEETIRRRRYQDATSCVAKSDAEGKYSIEGLRDEAHYVWAELAGFMVTPTDWQAQHNAMPGAVIDFVAKPVGRATVDVLLPDGSRPERAYVSWTQRSGNGGTSTSGQDWSPDDREIEREFGAWEVRAFTGASQESASETVTVHIEQGKEPPSVTLTVKERPGIKGSLVLPAGDNGHDIWVNALFYEDDVPDEAKFLKRGGGGGYYRGGEGFYGSYEGYGHGSSGKNYAFLDLKPGKYLLGAVRGQKLIASIPLVVGAGLVLQDLTIPELQTSDVVVVHVLGPDGKPALEASISSGYRVGQALYGGTMGNKKPDGSYWVAHAPLPEGIEGGTFVVTVSTVAWGSVEIAYEKKIATEVTVKFAEPASLVVTVTGIEGHTYADALSVAVVKEGDYNQPYMNEPPANKKEWTFGPFTPGKYEIRLVARTGDQYWGNSTVEKQTIHLVSGKNTATLAAPRLYKLKVTMKEKGEVALYLTREGDETQYGTYAQTDGKGVAEFGPLAAGRYNITNYNDGTVMIVNVPDQLDVQFTATTINAWRIDIKDTNGYAAALGLMQGDLVVGINGTEFESQKQMWRLLEDAPDKANMKFTVQRGAARLEITVDYAKIFDQSKSGCIMTPTVR